MKYPPSYVKIAQEHYGFDGVPEDSVSGIRETIINLHATLGKPKNLEFYTHREIAEMIKDIDRSS